LYTLWFDGKAIVYNKDKMNTMKTMMAVAAFALPTGNVQAQQAKTGTLVVYRKFSLAGCAATMPFYINGKLGAKLTNGYYCKLQLPAGEYTLTHDSLLWMGPDPQKVTVRAGQIVYFCNYCNAGGRVFEVADDQDGARDSVAHLKQQN
jgi:Protein of unknown function (DUF2846)